MACKRSAVRSRLVHQYLHAKDRSLVTTFVANLSKQPLPGSAHGPPKRQPCSSPIPLRPPLRKRSRSQPSSLAASTCFDSAPRSRRPVLSAGTTRAGLGRTDQQDRQERQRQSSRLGRLLRGKPARGTCPQSTLRSHGSACLRARHGPSAQRRYCGRGGRSDRGRIPEKMLD